MGKRDEISRTPGKCVELLELSSIAASSPRAPVRTEGFQAIEQITKMTGQHFVDVLMAHVDGACQA